MDLTVLSNGVELNVSGVTNDTTCLQVVYALAHATGQKGKFVLVAHFHDYEHRLSQTEKPLEIINQNHGTPVSFELRHLEEQPSTMMIPVVSSPLTKANNISSFQSVTALSSQPMKQSKRAISLPSQSFSQSIQRNARPPPPTYNQVIGQKYNSLSRMNHSLSTSPSFNHIEVPGYSSDDFTKCSRQELERILQIQTQVITQQKSQLVDLDVRLSNPAERELIQLRKQHNNLLTVLNSLRNANWPLRLKQEKEEADRLQRAIEEMKTIVDGQKTQLLNLMQIQQTLENRLEHSLSDAETISAQDDTSQYRYIADYVS
uniref:Ras-associating domain-containing protein n=1 Tax=Panagrolaimus sp. JU765 TaxID=591449 RepID=A0AC34Q6I2_9BILA